MKNKGCHNVAIACRFLLVVRRFFRDIFCCGKIQRFKTCNTNIHHEVGMHKSSSRSLAGTSVEGTARGPTKFKKGHGHLKIEDCII